MFLSELLLERGAAAPGAHRHQQCFGDPLLQALGVADDPHQPPPAPQGEKGVYGALPGALVQGGKALVYSMRMEPE